jgi:hypothetical protein
MVASLLLIFGHTYTKRRLPCPALPCPAQELESLQQLLQLNILDSGVVPGIYVIKAIVTEKKLWDCLFILGVAWMTVERTSNYRKQPNQRGS